MTFFDLLVSIGKFFVNTLEGVDFLYECSVCGVEFVVGLLQGLEVFQPKIWLGTDGIDKNGGV